MFGKIYIEDGNMEFKVIENGKEVNCKGILIFKDDSNDVNYIVYTEENDDNIYASRYELENDEIILQPIEHEYEWNLVDNMLESCGE